MTVEINWQDENGAPLTAIAFGNLVRPTEVVKQFKVQNSGTSTAENVVFSIVGSDSEAMAWKTLSADGTAYASTATHANIAAASATGVLHLKNTVPANATLGTHATQVRVDYIFS